MSTPVIEARQVRKSYPMGDSLLWAFKGIDVTIQQGEFVAVVGTSASGKSNFMNMVGCLDQPRYGIILLDGKDISRMNRNELVHARNRYLGFVFQQFNLLPRTSAMDNVALPLLYSNVPEREWAARAKQCLMQVGLGQRLDHQPSQLSGGQQQRVAIARALVNNPMLILADEPTGALDTKTSYEIMELFTSLNANGKTIVLVTHEPEIAEYAKRKLVFRDGELVEDIRNGH